MEYAPKCCNKPMELKCLKETGDCCIHGFFQCTKCGKLALEKVAEYTD